MHALPIGGGNLPLLAALQCEDVSSGGWWEGTLDGGGQHISGHLEEGWTNKLCASAWVVKDLQELAAVLCGVAHKVDHALWDDHTLTSLDWHQAEGLVLKEHAHLNAALEDEQLL